MLPGDEGKFEGMEEARRADGSGEGLWLSILGMARCYQKV